MQFSSHLTVGAVTALVSVKAGWIGLESLDILAVLVGCMLPDIDHPHSALGRRLKVLSVPIAKVFGHRGITHSLLIIAAGMWLLLYKLQAPPGWVTGLALGYFSHLAADFMTVAGIPLLWPWRQRFCFPLPIRTGSLSEHLIVALLVASSVTWTACGNQRCQPVLLELQMAVAQFSAGTAK